MLKALVIWIITLVLSYAQNVADIAFAPKLSWNFVFDGAEAKLAYGRPNSDEVGLMMTCAPHSGTVSVSGSVASADPRLTLVSGDIHTLVRGKAEPDPLTGGVWFEGSAPLDRGAIARFRKTGALSLKRDGADLRMAASADDRAAVGRFFRTCA